MRATLLPTVLIALGVACASASLAASASPPTKFVFLDRAALDALRLSNPAHYARAREIIADANELCRPKESSTRFVKYDVRDFSCEFALLRTSYPAKRQISFTIDDTRYGALVSVKSSARLLPAAP